MSEGSPGQIIEPCAACGQLMDVTEEMPFTEVVCPSCGASQRARKQFNNFTLVELVGEGGMGSVFKATDLNLRRSVALKILKKDAGSTETDWEKLEQEARVTASINHPHVVKVFSFGEDHGQFYLAMELVEKGSLDDLMGLQSRVPEAQVLNVGIQIAQGLQAALERGLLHRDVKPGNILFADANTAKIVDFGLAVLLDEEAQQRGEIWGTPYYIAPEKLDNRPEDFRSDLYSLGGTLFHALAGRPPFEATTASMVALKHIKSQAVSLQAFAPDVSSETAYVINRMLQKNPDDRYASYEELVGHLTYAREKLLERAQQPIRAKERVQVETKETRTVVGLVWMVTLLCVLVGLGALYVFRDTIFPPEEEGTEVVAGFSAEEFNEAIGRGRTAFLAGDYRAAREGYALAVAKAFDRQPAKNWALAMEGLSALMAGDVQESWDIFRGMEQAGLYSSKAEDQKQANFFAELGRLMGMGQVISPGTIAPYARDNYEVFALLAYGLKNWQLGDLDAAGPILEAYAAAKPDESSAWIKQLEPVAAPYLADYAIYNKLRTAGESASGAAVAGFEVQVNHAKQKTTTGTRVNDLLDALVVEARQRTP